MEQRVRLGAVGYTVETSDDLTMVTVVRDADYGPYAIPAVIGRFTAEAAAVVWRSTLPAGVLAAPSRPKLGPKLTEQEFYAAERSFGDLVDALRGWDMGLVADVDQYRGDAGTLNQAAEAAWLVLTGKPRPTAEQER